MNIQNHSKVRSSKKRTTFRSAHRIMAWLLSLLIIFGAMPLATVHANPPPENVVDDGDGSDPGPSTRVGNGSGGPQPQSVGPFKNVTHTLTLNPGHDQYCKRDMTGEIEFTWPEKSTYVDLVLIQDTSGSFEDTIGNVKEALNDIIDGLNMDTDIDGVSPRDRVMLVRFQGSEGAVQGNSSYDGNASISNQNDYYLVESSSLFTDKTAAKGAIANITDINGGTPTVDGMAEAQTAYEDEVSGNQEYNKSEYQVSGETRRRKTVYMLVTDGMANSATYNNLMYAKPDASPYSGTYGNFTGGSFSKTNSYAYMDNAKLEPYMEYVWDNIVPEADRDNRFSVFTYQNERYKMQNPRQAGMPGMPPGTGGSVTGIYEQVGVQANGNPSWSVRALRPYVEEDYKLQLANLQGYATALKSMVD